MDGIQYCIVLSEGLDEGLRHYVWASEKQIEDAMAGIRERSPFINKKELCCNYEEGIYKGKVRFKPSQLSSLVIETKSLEQGKGIFLLLSEEGSSML